MKQRSGVVAAGLLLFVVSCGPDPAEPAPQVSEGEGEGEGEGCGAGLVASGDACVDVNECATGNGGCDLRRACVNDDGSFHCGECLRGFAPFGDVGCQDIDECADGSDDCAVNEVCENSDGSFACTPCPAGFEASGSGCVDVDECEVDNGGCAVQRECLNDEGSFTCGTCSPGFEAFGAFGCSDVDECAADAAACAPNLVCRNTSGSFECTGCPSGFVTDNAGGCDDVDECLVENGGCHDGRVCQNDLGASHCGSCPAGFREDGPADCVDVNECETDNGGCTARPCVNTEGSRECGACQDGFREVNATRCDDINECAEATSALCDPATECQNLIGSFSCTDCPGGVEEAGTPLTGLDVCPDFLLVELLGYTVGPGVGDGTTWDGTSSVPQSTFDAIASAISAFNPIAGFAARIGGPLLASSVDAPDSKGAFTVNGADGGLNVATNYQIGIQDNDFFPSIDSSDFAPATNFCGLATGPSFALSLAGNGSLRLLLIDDDNIFDDDIGVVSLSKSQLVAASNTMSAETAGSVFIDVTSGRPTAPILDVNLVVRPAFFDELLDDALFCVDSCEFAGDGECDEPDLCPAGTDTSDCG